MKFILEIDLENDAFAGEDWPQSQAVATVLRTAVRHAEERDGELWPGDTRPLFDVNGNTIGHWRVSE